MVEVGQELRWHHRDRVTPFLRSSGKPAPDVVGAPGADLRICVLACDQGIGLVRTGEPEVPLALSEAAVDALTYLDLGTNRGALLNLRPAENLAEFLA